MMKRPWTFPRHSKWSFGPFDLHLSSKKHSIYGLHGLGIIYLHGFRNRSPQLIWSHMFVHVWVWLLSWQRVMWRQQIEAGQPILARRRELRVCSVRTSSDVFAARRLGEFWVWRSSEIMSLTDTKIFPPLVAEGSPVPSQHVSNCDSRPWVLIGRAG